MKSAVRFIRSTFSLKNTKKQCNRHMSSFRIEKDSMGEVQVPSKALYQAQTQRAFNNFPYSDRERLPPAFLASLARLKAACAYANQSLGLLDEAKAEHIQKTALDIALRLEKADNLSLLSIEEQKHTLVLMDQFPLSIFQTGSGTSSNMNMNEVIASSCPDDLKIHPNDHVNMSQSSNDAIPSAIQLSALTACHKNLLPALSHLETCILSKASTLDLIITTGRTHLMDAMPISYAQILSGWAAQIRSGRDRVRNSLSRLLKIPIGGTAVGTGVNAPTAFGPEVSAALEKQLGIKVEQSDNLFEGMSSVDAIVELSGQMKTIACSLMKISNDLRWMNSGPIAGLGEISLTSLQPGSSIMPGKVNPVIPESVCMVCAQVIGNDAAITIGGQSGNFQLNVMLPMVASNIIRSIQLLSVASTILADSAIKGFEVNEERISALVSKNPVLVTALNPVIGYELGAKIAKKAYQTNRPLKEVALEMTNLSSDELDRLLDPSILTKGGINEL